MKVILEANTGKKIQTPISGANIRPSSVANDKVDGPYAKYILAVMTLVCILNYVDRQVFAILAEEIKLDLGLSDADLGFLA